MAQDVAATLAAIEPRRVTLGFTIDRPAYVYSGILALAQRFAVRHLRYSVAPQGVITINDFYDAIQHNRHKVRMGRERQNQLSHIQDAHRRIGTTVECLPTNVVMV